MVTAVCAFGHWISKWTTKPYGTIKITKLINAARSFRQQAPLASFEELLGPPTERGDTAFSTGAGMRRRDLFVVGKITINLGSSPKSTYYKAKKLGDWGWFVWDAQAWVNIPEGHHLSPVEIGSNIVWFTNHGVDVEYLRVANSDQEMLLIHIPEQ
jgi:hypothetical protein